MKSNTPSPLMRAVVASLPYIMGAVAVLYLASHVYLLIK